MYDILKDGSGNDHKLRKLLVNAIFYEVYLGSDMVCFLQK